MNPIFIFGCIPARLALTYISTIVPANKLAYLGVILGLISFGFLWLFFTNGRLNAPESSSGKTWWANLRLIHGLLYLAAAIYAFRGSEDVWIPLLIDVLFGLLAYLFLKK